VSVDERTYLDIEYVSLLRVVHGAGSAVLLISGSFRVLQPPKLGLLDYKQSVNEQSRRQGDSRALRAVRVQLGSGYDCG
jgi:hypothetical protein